MKTSTNQALRDANQALNDLVRALAYIIFVIPASKVQLSIDSIQSFFSEIDIDFKKCLQILGVILLVSATVVIFSQLIGRALDIEADAQDAMIVEYKSSLNNMPEGE